MGVKTGESGDDAKRRYDVIWVGIDKGFILYHQGSTGMKTNPLEKVATNIYMLVK